MIERAVLDSGPLIHLSQIGNLKVLDCIEEGLTTGEIEAEVGQERLDPVDIKVQRLDAEGKDLSKVLVERYGIDLGEASVITLARQAGIDLVFTDDLDARDAADAVGVEPHGTLALVTRAFSNGIIGEDRAIETVESLYHDSSLFITRNLVDWAIDRIEAAE